MCVHIVLEVTSQYRRIHPETPGPHHSGTFHTTPHRSHSVPQGAAESRAGGEEPFTCRFISMTVNLYLQQQQPVEQTDPHTNTDMRSTSCVCVSRSGWKLVAKVFLIKDRCLWWW